MHQIPNVMAPDVRDNPYPFYAALRRAPVQQVDPGGMWAISRYNDVFAVLKNPAVFSSAAWGVQGLPPWLTKNSFSKSILGLDPPDHTKLRALVTHTFSAVGIARLEAEARHIAEELAESLPRRGEVDFMSEHANRLPGRIMSLVLGLDGVQHGQFREWANAMADVYSGPMSPEQMERIRVELTAMDSFFTELLDRKRREPGIDTTTQLLQSEIDGRRLSQDELLNFLSLLLVAGIEPTSHLLGNAMLTLADNPDVFERVRADPSLVPRFIEEVARYEPPVHAILRLTKESVSLGGATIPAGALVLVLIGSAGRDEERYPQADLFLLDREQHQDLVFGHGIHYCLGSALARMQARLMIQTLLPRIKSCTRAPGPVAWKHALNLRGPTALQLRIEAA